MEAPIHSTSSTATRSWKNSASLAALVLVTAVASAIFGLLTLGAHPTPAAGRATSMDNLRLQLEVQERDEAAFAASWAESRATEHSASPKVIKVAPGGGCGVDCVESTWPDGTAISMDLTSLLDLAAICACPIEVRPR